MSGQKIPVIAVVGPTASGKTALAVTLAKTFGGEIVGADSMQIYRGFPIASAAPTAEERAAAPYHLAEILDPTAPFSVAAYVDLAAKTVREIAGRGALPILCGGTGLYVDSLLGNIRFLEEPENRVRERLEEEADIRGVAVLLDRLRDIDPTAAAKLHENDRKRVIRALEVYELHGITKTELDAASKNTDSPYRVLFLGITCRDRDKLYRRIDARVDEMIGHGLPEEAQKARETLGATAVQAIGHKELYPYLDGEISLAEAADHLKRATRRYAKRQLTWFRRNPDIHWLCRDETDVTAAATELVKNFLTAE